MRCSARDELRRIVAVIRPTAKNKRLEQTTETHNKLQTDQSQATSNASAAGLQYQYVESATIFATQSGLLLFSSMYLLKPLTILMQPSTHFEVILSAMGARNLSVRG